MSEDKNSNSGGITLFGRDLSKIPCFRTSFMYGIMGGMGTGMLYFLKTSNIRTAPHVAFVSYMAITAIAWGFCRYSYSKMSQIEEKVLKRAIQEQILLEGTDEDPNLKKA